MVLDRTEAGGSWFEGNSRLKNLWGFTDSPLYEGGGIETSGIAHTKDVLTNAALVLMVAGAVVSIVGYVRLGTSESCLLFATCVGTEYPFDLAALYAGLLLVAGGFAGIVIIWHSSRQM